MTNFEATLDELKELRAAIVVELRRMDTAIEVLTYLEKGGKPSQAKSFKTLVKKPRKQEKGPPLAPVIADIMLEAGPKLMTADEVAQQVINRGYPCERYAKGRTLRSTVQAHLSSEAHKKQIEKQWFGGVVYYRKAQLKEAPLVVEESTESTQ